MSPRTAFRPWPTVSGPVGLAETYSTSAVSLAWSVLRPHASPASRIRASPSARCALAKRTLMNPGPATSTASTRDASGSQCATMPSAIARGARRRGRASWRATFVARSPCEASFGV